MKYEEKILSSEYPFRGKILNLRHDTVELPDGRTSKREIVEHSGGVCVLALDENRNVLLVRQYRISLSPTKRFRLSFILVKVPSKSSFLLSYLVITTHRGMSCRQSSRRILPTLFLTIMSSAGKATIYARLCGKL